MMSRRVLIGTGALVAGGAAVIGAAQITHKLDDAARLVGLEPKPEPDPRDSDIVRETSSDQAAVTATAVAIHAKFPALDLSDIVAICEEQLRAVGGTTAATDIAALPVQQSAAVQLLATMLSTSSKARATAAGEAFSPELVRVLASMSAGLAQSARQVGALR